MSQLINRRAVNQTGFDAIGNRRLDAATQIQHGRALLVPLHLLERLDAEAEQREEEAETRRIEKAAAAAVAIASKLAKEEPAQEDLGFPVTLRNHRRVTIFSPQNVAAAKRRLETNLREKAGTKDQPSPAMKIFARAQANDGMRALPDARRAAQRVAALGSRFENLAEPIEYLATMLALAARQPANEFRIPPLLLVGPPGIGKTYFAQALAEAMGEGVPWRRFSAGQAQSGFQLTGTANGWSTASPGIVFDMLLGSPWATGVLVLDELDKLAGDRQFPVLPTVLDLLADTTASTFEDLSIHLKFDASRLVVVGTANHGDAIDSALQSRMQHFEVQAPSVDQRRRIVEAEWASLCKRGRSRRQLDADSVQEAAERVDLDLRVLGRALTSAFAKSLLRREAGTVALELPRRELARRAAGFS